MGARICLSGAAADRAAYPMTNTSASPSGTFGPNREAMSSGGTAEPTFQVTMWTLEDRSEGRKREIQDPLQNQAELSISFYLW